MDIREEDRLKMILKSSHINYVLLYIEYLFCSILNVILVSLGSIWDRSINRFTIKSSQPITSL